MPRLWIAVCVVAVSLTLPGCNRDDRSPANTQPGGARDLSQGPRAGAAPAKCNDLPDANALRELLTRAPAAEGEAGGLFSGHYEWATIVNRNGEICAVAASQQDATALWPGSLSISKAKAFTANGFSTDTQPLSTARLYTLTQPGHSLWGIAAAVPFNPNCLDDPAHLDSSNGKVCGGAIAFGGGVPLYRNKTRVGGLGLSGDTACADHEIAKRMRHLAGLDPEKGEFVDDITFASADGASVYSHPVCPNTWRNGKKIGDEANGS